MKRILLTLTMTILTACGASLGGTAAQPYFSMETTIKRVSPDDKSIIIDVRPSDSSEKE